MQCRFLETSALWNNMNLSIVWWIIINSCVLVQKSGIIVENPSLACFFGWNFLGENSGNENKMANITSELCMQHCYLCIQEMLPLRNTSVAKSFWKQGHPDSCCWSSNEHEREKNKRPLSYSLILGDPGPSALSPLVYVQPATLRGLQLIPKTYPFRTFKESELCNGAKKASKCVWMFSHYFFDLYAPTNAEFFVLSWDKIEKS